MRPHSNARGAIIVESSSFRNSRNDGPIPVTELAAGALAALWHEGALCLQNGWHSERVDSGGPKSDSSGADQWCGASPDYSPPCLSHPAPRVLDAVSRARLLNRPQVCLRGLARNPAPNPLRIEARHPALVNNPG